MKAPALSERTHRIEPFHTMELMKRAVALQQTGHPVIHMSIGEPDFKAPEPVVAALERAVRAGVPSRPTTATATGWTSIRHASW